jgi:hypothetical protein
MISRQAILQSARVADLRTAANEVAALCRPSAPVELPRKQGDRRRLLMLLACERRRSAKLVDLIKG